MTGPAIQQFKPVFIWQILENEFIRAEVFQDMRASRTGKGSATSLKGFSGDEVFQSRGLAVEDDISELQNDDIVDAICLWEILHFTSANWKV